MDGKAVQRKLVGSDDERAVSPVIGVILMVAITVILAAVIAAFVLDMGSSQSQNAQAGVSFDEESDVVTVSVTSMDRAESLEIQSGACDSPDYNSGSALEGVGETATVDCNSAGDSTTIQVIGEYDGSENVITTYDYEP
nr:type IV pilin N-terminal domain-containing protein [Natrinema salifodinae]